ncbi:MAG: MotA/TolQ/ExbB proton channel family protein [Fibrobacterota bacterium]
MYFFHELLKAFLPSREAFFFMWILAVVGISAFCIAVERWFNLQRRTDYDAAGLFSKLRQLLDAKQLDEAYNLCASGGRRALPRILAAGIKKAQVAPLLVMGGMREESQHMAGMLERRLGLLVMFSNVCTLFGLLGTVFGLIMSFTAVSRPGVPAIEKSALLAAGISTAMNATLVGLTLSVLCVIVYAFLRARVDAALNEIDRYSVAILNLLNPPELMAKMSTSLTRRGGNEEEVADADVTPMLNLMIILIPVLLTSSEFVKMGTIELKLPESSQGGGGGGGGGGDEQKEMKLELGVIITAKGFTLFHSLQGAAAANAVSLKDREPDVPLIRDDKGQEAYDFKSLNNKLVEVKQRVLYEIVKTYVPGTLANASLEELYRTYTEKRLGTATYYADNESIKLVGEETIRYETVVAVMDAARGLKTKVGVITLFPNVSIAGGIVQ